MSKYSEILNSKSSLYERMKKRKSISIILSDKIRELEKTIEDLEYSNKQKDNFIGRAKEEIVKLNDELDNIYNKLVSINKDGIATKPNRYDVKYIEPRYYHPLYEPLELLSVEDVIKNKSTSYKVGIIKTMLYDCRFEIEYKNHIHYIQYDGRNVAYCVSDKAYLYNQKDYVKWIAECMMKEMNKSVDKNYEKY